MKLFYLFSIDLLLSDYYETCADPSVFVKIYWNSLFLIRFTTLIINCH